MTPVEALSQYIAKYRLATGFCVAYSGGVDSHVLLSLVADLARRDRSLKVRALHVDHSLHPDSDQWAEHACDMCAIHGIPLQVRTVTVASNGDGPEASARHARYQAFAEGLADGEHVLLAQHADDQAETFLMQALRGSGPDGLAGIPRIRKFSSGYLGRPLLYCTKESVLETARSRNLKWIDDPSNQDERLNRNFLRRQIMPLLKSRWPAAVQTLGRSAQRCAQTRQSVSDYAQQDLNSARLPGQPELSIAALAALPKERAFAAIRLWLRQRELRMPHLQDLEQVHSSLLHARPDTQGIVNVRDYEFRRHRDSLYILEPGDAARTFRHEWQAPFDDLLIPETGLVLTRDLCVTHRIRLPDAETVIVKSRAGGELIRVGSPPFYKKVKQILQEADVPPWRRASIPLLYAEDQLIAVWGLAVADSHCLPAARQVAEYAEPADAGASAELRMSRRETA